MREVLALHCGLGAGAGFGPLGAHLPHTRLACPDLPGHGAAPAWAAGRDFQTQALELALAEAAPGPSDVVGHSFGGTLALRLLVEHPERVRSLVLVEPVMFAAADPTVAARHWHEMAHFDVALSRGDRAGAARFFLEVWGDRRGYDDLPERLRSYVEARISLIPHTKPSIMDDVHAVLPRLPARGPPTLLMTRIDPPEIVASIADGLADHMPWVERRRIGDGHMMPVTDPAGFALALRRFWEGQG